MNKFYVIIYHPSRFVCIIHLSMLIYRYLGRVIDASKTGKSTRFGVIPHDFLTTLYQILHIIVEKLRLSLEKIK